MHLKILYEDNHLIAIYKPAGVLVQKGEGPEHDDDTLYWQLKQFIKERDQKPGNVFLGVLHRLDRPVSGIVLFAKTSKGAARLSEQFRERDIQKTYHALVVGRVEPKSGTLRDELGKNEKQKRATIGEGQEAVLHYKVLKENNKHSLLKINLETGKFHQIRAQLSNIGHPIVGDSKYGAKEFLPDNSIALCATDLKFITATTEEEKSISIPYPSEWDSFLE
ncbi:RluA family pseudouridine synthase [Candidatus Parcubacteria bacterium]|nr:RluA family pseudouridine synthase [Candidatus Parcubacteria bacterium]